MNGKLCSQCKKLKPLSHYHKRGFDKNGNPRNRSECKECKNKYSKNRIRVRYNDEKHCVYFLPSHNYIGMTNNFTERMNKHKNKNGRNVSNVIKVFESNDEISAHLVETLLHSFGFDGYNIGASNKDIKPNPQIKLFDIYKLMEK